ncbi:DNA repair protein RecN [Maribacter hydrothermalis]|uniref:DNA repair protein RecN n=1 Tax=Maribacter hydrothermalis TaxID=1836467 RepID=A0A1B7Z7Z0_9FLAO|nr:DNA repair protein RecN [Maribacter hydrothermalis]APQ19162.1 DNA repair protein RecN [Maribacter hydrothermalis]OBR38827.1 DNA repair protein RecN [Maribacter hydrothermalis]
MLSTLTITNYALIDSLEVDFDKGFTVITGETGAGKSILLGGLSLVLGKRADLSSLRVKEEKCIIEGIFKIEPYGLQNFFVDNDLDYDVNTVIRREILPSGKSRAFINDTPVTLDVLSRLGENLIDIHSQHQTLQLTENDFQLKLVDALANNQSRLVDYRKGLKTYRKAQKELENLIEVQNTANKEQDYNSFLLEELEKAPLKIGMIEELEEEYEQLNNVELIMEQLSKGDQLFNDEQIGVLPLVTEMRQSLAKLVDFGSSYKELYQRVQSVLIELDDISSDVQQLQDGVEANPELLEEVNGKLQLVYNLLKKHNVGDISELITIKNELADKVFETAHLDEKISLKTREIQEMESVLEEQSVVLREKRNEVIPELKKKLESDLSLLGMPSASFEIKLSTIDVFTNTGMDELSFLFTANKGGHYGELKKVASGGELSRIMLVIKAILAKYEKLPTIMFDEIDTGVSGEISNRMADIMKDMSADLQVFSITHLPQVASKGNNHFKVYKTEGEERTMTNLKKLTNEERVVELAHMLGGKDLSDSALAHARQLLN